MKSRFVGVCELISFLTKVFNETDYMVFDQATSGIRYLKMPGSKSKSVIQFIKFLFILPKKKFSRNINSSINHFKHPRFLSIQGDSEFRTIILTTKSYNKFLLEPPLKCTVFKAFFNGASFNEPKRTGFVKSSQSETKIKTT